MARELILGGARSGKSARAEAQAAAWLAADPAHQALLLATAWPADAEMAARIARHQQDRAVRVPGLATREVGLALPAALLAHSQPQCLLVVDCLTLWLTQCRMPPPGLAQPMGEAQAERAEADLLTAVQQARGPVLLVSNEIGLGLLPLSREARAVVDALGRLHQRLAQVCERVTLVVAGLPLALKGAA